MTSAPPAFHVMAKPTGADCNLTCEYCFFRDKARLYPGSTFRMSDEVMERFVRQTLQAQRVPLATLAFQGGEPTLMGVDFFRRALEVARRNLRPGVTLECTLQTNGVLLDEEWCDFLREGGFLVGLSIDGPRGLHDAFRRDRGNGPTFDRVVRAARLMQRLGVEFNVLCTVNAANADHPLEVYRFFRDELGARYLQAHPHRGAGARRRRPGRDRHHQPLGSPRAVRALPHRGVRRVGAARRGDDVRPAVRRRARGLAARLLEPVHLPPHLRGNILQTPLAELVGSEKQRAFGEAKSKALPRCCRECEFLFACHGECPKNRVLMSPDGEPGHNWLCAGLKAFFRHTQGPMRAMAELLRRGRPASDGMALAHHSKKLIHGGCDT